MAATIKSTAYTQHTCPNCGHEKEVEGTSEVSIEEFSRVDVRDYAIEHLGLLDPESDDAKDWAVEYARDIGMIDGDEVENRQVPGDVAIRLWRMGAIMSTDIDRGFTIGDLYEELYD